jgi:hypothetical protein
VRARAVVAVDRAVARALARAVVAVARAVVRAVARVVWWQQCLLF